MRGAVSERLHGGGWWGSSCRGEMVVMELLDTQDRVEFVAGCLKPYNCCIQLISSNLSP